MDIPLAEELRPKTFADVASQDHLVGEDGLLTKLIEKGRPFSILLWGPPGCGKTTIARLYAKAFDRPFKAFSGAASGIAEIKKYIQETKNQPLLRQSPILFIDEVHRFNKAQQDLFLPYIEDGTIVLIAATTENPAFTVNNALLSRLRTVTLQPLTREGLEQIIERFLKTAPITLTPDAVLSLTALARGDGRHLLNLLENIQTLRQGEIDANLLEGLIQERPPAYDRDGENHYNLISALHKAIRGSDPDAALYWFSRMLEGGEDPNFLARRLTRMAIEDVGLADPEAKHQTLAAWQIYERLGSPEGDLALAESVLYLALAPKSNASYLACKGAQKCARENSHLTPPKHILNAPTSFMKKEGYGEGYQYDHNEEHAFSGQNYFPEEMAREKLYNPVERGFEREMKKRVEFFENLRKKLSPSGTIPPS